MFMKTVLAVLCLALCHSASAQSLPKISLQTNATDAVGKLLSKKFRGDLEDEFGADLVQTADQKSDIQISLITVDPSRGADMQTVYSVLWTAEAPGRDVVRYLLDHAVGVCEKYEMKRCTEHLIKSTVDAAARYIEAHEAAGGPDRSAPTTDLKPGDINKPVSREEQVRPAPLHTRLASARLWADTDLAWH
jgi:hypothetical protein